MMRHPGGFARQVYRRIFQRPETERLDTQDLRNKWVDELGSMFDMATSIAKGEISQQTVGDKSQTITPKERQMWAQVAANIASVMGNLAKAYDERQFNEDLAELERQLEEWKELRDKKG